MSKSYENKMMGTATAEQDFFFPEYGITIKATSREEAEKKLQEIINQNKK